MLIKTYVPFNKIQNDDITLKHNLDYLDSGHSTNGNLTISSDNKLSDSGATSDFSTSHR